MEYANKATKEFITRLAACVGFAETLLQSEFRNKEKAEQNIAEMKNQGEKALAAIMEGLDTDQAIGILRFSRNSELIVMPKYDPRAKKDYYVVEEEALDRLMGDAVSECEWCDKDEKATRRCQKRKDLLQCGALVKSTSDCPFRG